MKERFVTITGFKNYYGLQPFAIGNVIRCSKEPGNFCDGEAIKCTLPVIGTVGYIANSPGTVAGGTMSAGRVYDHVRDRFYVRVQFTTFTKVICRIESGCPEEMERQIKIQIRDDWDDDAWDGCGEAND